MGRMNDAKLDVQDAGAMSAPEPQSALTLNDASSALDGAAEHIIPLLKGLGGVIVIIIAVAVVYRVVSRLIRVAERGGRLSPTVGVALRRIARWAAIVVAIFASLQVIGVFEDAWTFLSTVLAMVAIGFVAVWSVLSNTMCSVILMIARPFEVGDTVELAPEGLKGRVVNFTLIFTTLRREDDSLIQVPNNMFFQKAVIRERGQHTIGLDEQLNRPEDAA